MEAITKLVARLEAIARKNDDRFAYCINIEPRRDGIVYEFTALETADQHAFVSGEGPTIEAAVARANDDVADACEEWSYEA